MSDSDATAPRSHRASGQAVALLLACLGGGVLLYFPGLHGYDPSLGFDATLTDTENLFFSPTGSSARQTEATDNRPCDAIIMAIVDSWELHGEEVYRK